MNLLGFSTGRHYPNKAFFQIAREVGNDVILGCDAHAPGRVADPREIEEGLRFLQSCGISRVTEEIKLRQP